MSDDVNPIGIEPILQESNSYVLPLHYGLICRPNRIRTHTTRVETLHAIHYTIDLITSTGGETSIGYAQDKLLLSHLYRRRDSNSQIPDSKSGAYTNSATPAFVEAIPYIGMVTVTMYPETSGLPLSYTSILGLLRASPPRMHLGGELVFSRETVGKMEHCTSTKT